MFSLKEPYLDRFICPKYMHNCLNKNYFFFSISYLTLFMFLLSMHTSFLKFLIKNEEKMFLVQASSLPNGKPIHEDIEYLFSLKYFLTLEFSVYLDQEILREKRKSFFILISPKTTTYVIQKNSFLESRKFLIILKGIVRKLKLRKGKIVWKIMVIFVLPKQSPVKNIRNEGIRFEQKGILNCIMDSCRQINIDNMFDQQEIFDSDVEIDDKDVRPTDYIGMDEDKYIDQFLSIGDLDLEPFQIEEQPIIEDIPQPEEYVQEAFEEPLIVEKTHKKRSTFHNFQKHLVTTIRAIIDPSQLGRDSETRPCEIKLWKLFMNSNKINKTLVTIVFGGLGVEQIIKNPGYGFEDILIDFQPAMIQEAQNNLTEQVIKQLKEADMKKELSDRRMKNKQEFIVYFRAFLEELVNGDLQKRMAKCTKLLKQGNF